MAICSCEDRDKVIHKTFSEEIPTWSSGTLDQGYLRIRQKINLLGLDDLEEGFDSIQIRVWNDYWLTDLRDVFIFKLQNTEWSGEFIAMNVDGEEKIKKIDKIGITPKSGWNQFIDSLQEKQITTLPNMRDIGGLNTKVNDGETHSVEIGTKKYYRFYSYDSPRFFQEHWQAKNMTEILELINKEFWQK